VREEEGSRHFLGLLESNGSRALVALFLQISAETFSTRHVAWGRTGSTKLMSLALVALSLHMINPYNSRDFL
jgi:hypothetical protein